MASPKEQQITEDVHSGIAWHFKLPPNGLSLRSVSYVDGVAKLHFDASPKVPTITQEDVACALRLASEGKRPEFFYIAIPPWHPYHGRQFKQYSPMWLRGTSVGELLSEADWQMKCLDVGAQSDEEKSKFWSWQKKSNLTGLATSLDFPHDAPQGSIIMSCELAKVQTNESAILFPEEPKIQIISDRNSAYSKYITDTYPSVAYHDEPLFLKMQELIKLILAAEWLTEKGVKTSKEWMMACTATKAKQQTAIEGSSHADPSEPVKEPPSSLMPPQPTEVKIPPTDVTVKTTKKGEDQNPAEKNVVGRVFGWIDHGSGEMLLYDEDGKYCGRLKSQKSVVKLNTDVAGQPPSELTCWVSIPFHPDSPTSTSGALTTPESATVKPFTSSHELVSPQLGRVSFDLTIVKNSDDSDTVNVTVNLAPTQATHTPLVKQTMTVTSAVDDPDKLFSHMDPNKPLRPHADPDAPLGKVVPHVKSWSELFTETVPWPHIVWVHADKAATVPTVAVKIASGGVSTRDFPIQRETLNSRAMETVTPRVEQYLKSATTLDIEAQRYPVNGSIRFTASNEFTEILSKFRDSWDGQKGTCPTVDCVFAVENSTLLQKFSQYKKKLSKREVVRYFHGTSLACDITSSQKLCANQSCGICGISSDGLKPEFIKQNISFQRFGRGFYLAPHSSKCHDYTQGTNGYRAMLLCDVCPGRKYHLQHNSQQLQGPPPGYDSIYGDHGQLNYPEIVLHNPAAVLPRYIVMYKKNGIKHQLAT